MEQNADVWRYFFYPDLSRLTFDSLSAAIGQVCFTLSIGFGTMITFGSYLKDEAKVSGTGFRVVTMDSLTAIISGLLIFPLIGEAMRGEAGPELLFRTVPGFLLKFEGGKVFGIFFFICLYLAALGASISLLETVVANMMENTKFGRGRASLLAGLGCLVASIPAAFSSTVFASVRIGDRGLLQSMDYYLINWLVPALALIFCLVSTYKISEKWQKDEFIADENDEHSGQILFTHWNILMRWVIPPLIILSLIMQVVALFT